MSAIATAVPSRQQAASPTPCESWPFPPFFPAALLSHRYHPAGGLDLAESEGAARQDIETLIRERFAAAYQARIRQFMPRLVGLRDADGALRGACGLREAADSTLFLERYLDQPIEAAIAAAGGGAIRREDVVEVGQFAGSSAGVFRCMIRLLTARLHGEGYRWVVFTGTRALRNTFARLGLEPQVLGPADPGRLRPGERTDWGSYYRYVPTVMFGDIAEGFKRMAAEAGR